MKRFSLPLLLMLLLTATACEIAPTPQLSVNPDPLEVSADGGKVTLSISAVGEWTVRANFTTPHNPDASSFFSVLTHKGLGNGEVPVTFDPNPYGFQTRNAEIVFECVSGVETCTVILPVIQKEADPVFAFTDWNEPRIPSNGGSFSATLLHNCKCVIDIDTEGIAYSVKLIGEDRFLGPSEIAFSVPANPTSSDRDIIVTLRPDGKEVPSKAYKFTQAGSY